MKISKDQVLQILRGEGSYANGALDNLRAAIKSFYVNLNIVNACRDDFHQKTSAPVTGTPAKDLTQYDFQSAFSRLIYGTNVCVALSFFEGNILIATNKEDYSDDVVLPNLRSNYNAICRYIGLISDISKSAHKPLWVDQKLVKFASSHNYDELAGNLASVIVAKTALCRRVEDEISQINQMFQARDGEAKVVRDFTIQYNLEEELQKYKEFAMAILEDFFNYKSSHFGGDLVSGWRTDFAPICPPKRKWEDIKAQIINFLRDLVIVESFTSHHPENEFVQTLARGAKLVVVDDEGNEVGAVARLFGAKKSVSDILEIEGIRLQDVHAEMKILQYQMKHGGFSKYVAVSKLCCAFCHLSFVAIDHGSKDHYPGYHGNCYPVKLSEWMKQNPNFLQVFLGEEAFGHYSSLSKSPVTLENGAQVDGGALLLLLIEAMPKLASDLPGFVVIPQGVANAPDASDNRFLIDFGTGEHPIEQKYYSCRSREVVEHTDGAGCEILLIGVDNTQ